MTPEALLRDHTSEVRDLAQQLRQLIHATLPGMREKGYSGWHAIGFHHPAAGYVCGIFPKEQSVRFLFEHGVLLSDPEGILQGDGKQTRHIDLCPSDQIPTAALEWFLLEAVSLRS
jgi:hypothetical protein